MAQMRIFFGNRTATGGGTITGSVAATETGSDTASLAGRVVISGTLAATETGADIAAIAGQVPISGSAPITETTADTAAITGQVIISGAMAATESGSDTAAIYATQPSITGSLSATESGSDTATVTGKVVVSGSLTATESGSDTAAIYTARPPITGSLTATESGSDTAYITNITAIPSLPDAGGGGGGGSWRTKWKHKKELRDLIDKALSLPPEELEEVVEKELQPEPIAKLLIRGKISSNLEEVKEEVVEDFRSVLKELEQKLQTLSKSREEASWQETLKQIEEEEEEEVVVKHLLDYNTAVLINNNVWELLCRFILTSALHAD